MNNDWQTHLQAHGAHIEDATVQHFGDPKLELEACTHQNVLCALSHLAVIALNGVDSYDFLQGQVSNDVKLLDAHHTHLTGYCSAKGRLLALFLAYADQDAIYLQLPQTLLETVIKRLNMYVLRSKVAITPANRVSLGINGPDARTLVSTVCSNVPDKPFEKVSEEGINLIKLPSHAFDRYLLIVDPEHAHRIWTQLQEHCQVAGKPVWDWLEIQAGIPEIVGGTQEQFVPQMVNLDLLGGINFKKGCYTGQEIVARTHYLGTVKRRSYLAHLSPTLAIQMPQAGDKLHTGDQQDVGQIVRASRAPEGGVDMLVELRIEAKESGNVCWQTHKLEFKPLPYSLSTGD